MGGIIAGFIGGVGKGMADAGRMMLADKLQKERDEANFLRDSELRKTMQQQGFEHAETMQKQGFEHTETTEASRRGHAETLQKQDQEHRAGLVSQEIESREGIAKAEREQTDWDNMKDRENRLEIANIRAQASDSNSTNQMKNYNHLRTLGVPPDDALAISHNAYEKIIDPDTKDSVLVNPATREEIGRLATVNGKKEWVPAGKQTANAQVTSRHTKQAKKWAAENASFWNSDHTDFNQWPGKTGKDKRANAEAAMAQQYANEERDNAPGLVDKPGNPADAAATPGIVDQAVAPPTEPAVAEPAEETKKVGRRNLTKGEFITLMENRYGKEKLDEIIDTWNSLP